MSREELLEIITSLPEDKVAQAITLLKPLYISAGEDAIAKAAASEANTGDSLDNRTACPDYSQQYLHGFLGYFVSITANLLYDLAYEAEKKQDPILSKHHEFTRKKLQAAWQKYLSNKDDCPVSPAENE